MKILRYYAKLHWIEFALPILGILLSVDAVFLLKNQSITLQIIIALKCLLFFYSLRLLLLKISTKITLYDGGLNVQTGIISKYNSEIYLWSIKSVSVFKPLGNILRFGTVAVNTGENIIKLRVSNPDRLAAEINKQLHEIHYGNSNNTTNYRKAQ